MDVKPSQTTLYRWDRWLLAGLLGIMSLVYGYPEILNRRPQGLHAWRQADCLSITLNFKDTDTPFHRPQIHYLGHHGDGSALSDFPLIHFVVGRSWRVVGQQEWIYRAMVLSLFFTSLFLLHGTLRQMLMDSFASVFIVGLLFTSPMLAYYANNFLMNVPALSMAIIGWTLFWRYLGSGRKAHIILCLLAFLLAAAFKATAALSLIAVTLILALHHHRWGKRLLGVHQIKHASLGLGIALCSMASLVLWYRYAHAYNSANDSGVFLVGTLPVWEVTGSAFRTTVDGIITHFKRDYFRPFVYPILMLAAVAALVWRKRVPPVLLMVLLLLLTGAGAISLLFFGALEEHDYYSLDQLVIVPLLLAAGFLALPPKWRTAAQGWFARIALLAILVHCTDFARRRMIDRYGSWMNHTYLERVHWYGSIGPKLEDLGIPKDARVVSLPDPSFNITLYLMDRRGWTDFDSLSYHPDRLDRCIAMGAEYLLVHDEAVLERPGLRSRSFVPLGSHGSIRIYRLEGGM